MVSHVCVNNHMVSSCCMCERLIVSACYIWVNTKLFASCCMKTCSLSTDCVDFSKFEIAVDQSCTMYHADVICPLFLKLYALLTNILYVWLVFNVI